VQKPQPSGSQQRRFFSYTNTRLNFGDNVVDFWTRSDCQYRRVCLAPPAFCYGESRMANQILDVNVGMRDWRREAC